MAYRITEDCIGCGACRRSCIVFAIEGEQKKLHHINEKRCIDCGVCGRVCPKQAVVDAGGQAARQAPRQLWPKPEIDAALCSACAICVEACTLGALRIAYPKFKGDIRVAAELAEPKKCVACGLCAHRCPLKAIRMAGPQQGKEAAS